MFNHLFIKKKNNFTIRKSILYNNMSLLSIQSVLSSTWQGDTRLYGGAEECSNNLFNCLDPQETTLTKV